MKPNGQMLWSKIGHARVEKLGRMPPSQALRVLVVGDHGSGKSTLIHGLETGGPPNRAPRPTVGCSIRIIQSFGGGSEDDFLVELREVGGHPSFASARAVFYRDFDAVICMFDASSSDMKVSPVKSWIDELSSHLQWGVDNFRRDSDDQESGLTEPTDHSSPQPHQHHIVSGVDGGTRLSWLRRPEGFLPLLYVGNKLDRLEQERSLGSKRDVLFLSAIDPHLDSNPLHEFFLLASKLRGGKDDGRRRDVAGSGLRPPMSEPPRPAGIGPTTREKTR